MDTHINQKIKEYYFKKLLGRGNFGCVYLVEDSINKCLAACKVINKNKIKQIPKLRELINNEIMVLFNCQNKNIVSYLASFEDEHYVYIVMEYCNGGDLEEYTKLKGGKLSQQQAKYLLKEIVNGFKSIRTISAVHRDFKLQNLLMSNGVVKIADLGFSKILSTQEETHTVLGTLYTMAPEVIAKLPYGPQCDIWSLGTVYYKLLYGKYPYLGANYAEMLKMVRGKALQFNSSINVSNQSKDFITRCLTIDPAKRITWAEIESHPLLSYFPKIIVSTKIPDQILKTREFYIRNCPILRINNPASFPDVALSSAITEQRLNNPLEKKVLQNRIHSYYQTLYITIREYVVARITNAILLIEEFLDLPQLKGHVSIQEQSCAGYIITRETLRQITELLESVIRKQNILQFTHLANEFFISQQCKSLIQLFKNDQSTLIHYTAKFKHNVNKEDMAKLQGNQVSVPEKIIQRERRYLIQYAIQLFNNINKINKQVAKKIFLLINFIADEVENKYKVPEFYTKFSNDQDLKVVWTNTKDMLGRLKKNYQ